jgi:hypothetical protein
MPQIQVLGREAIEAQNNIDNRVLERQKMMQQAMEKRTQFQQMAEQLKLMAKNTDNDVEKIRVQRLGDKMAYLANVFKLAMDNPNPESVVGTALKLGGDDLIGAMTDPTVQDMIKNLSPSGETQQQIANAALVNKIASGGALGVPTEEGGPNQAASDAIGGNMGWSSFTPPGSGLQLENWGEQARGAAMKEKATKRVALLEDMSSAAAPALSIIDTMERGWNEAFKNNPEKGINVAQGISNVVGGSWLRGDTNIRSYLTTQAALLTKLARGLGEKGVITDKDVARVQMALAGAFENKEVARKNFQIIRETIRGGFDHYAKFGPYGSPQDLARQQNTMPMNPSGSNDPLGLFGGQ